MLIDARTLAYARRAIRDASRTFLYDPNITLIDFGLPEHRGYLAGDELAVRFHVSHKLSGVALESAIARGRTRLVPPSINGFPTDVPQATYHLHRWGSANRWLPTTAHLRANPIQGGISISNERQYTFGTLGGIVQDRTTGAPMILSNWHVLAGDWWARKGQRIYQPGRMDSGSHHDTVATLERDAMSVNLDAAVATLNGQRAYTSDVLNLRPVTGVGQPEVGMQVVKSGRRTGITFGQITGIEGVTTLPYGQVTRMIRNVITIDPRHQGDEVSAGGDSGSWWMDVATMRVVGLHFAGSDRPERGLAIDMPRVLDVLNVALLNR